MSSWIVEVRVLEGGSFSPLTRIEPGASAFVGSVGAGLPERVWQVAGAGVAAKHAEIAVSEDGSAAWVFDRAGRGTRVGKSGIIFFCRSGAG